MGAFPLVAISARSYAQFPILSPDWWEKSRCVFSLPLLIVSMFFVSFRFGLQIQVCFFIRFFLEQFIFLHKWPVV